jgi:hypothetical protein
MRALFEPIVEGWFICVETQASCKSSYECGSLNRVARGADP